MGMRINTNVDALSAMRNLSTLSVSLSQSIERLSSGMRINHAADDAAGLSISQKLEAQVRGTAGAQRNAQDGISLLQTADGALDEVHTILQRMRELAVQGGNDTLTTLDRNAITAELKQMGTELDAIGSQTTFNTQQLFVGPSGAGGLNATFQVGPDCGQTLTVNLQSQAINSTLVGGATVIGITTEAKFTAFIHSADVAINSVSTLRAVIGAGQNRLQSISRRLGVANTNMASAESRIRDADMAQEAVNFNKNLILQQAGIAVLAQANQAPNQILPLLR